jgi:hypothetical protein
MAFNREEFLEIDPSETRIAFHRCSLPNFSSFGKAVSEEKIF